jgi:hypothetical protein
MNFESSSRLGVSHVWMTNAHCSIIQLMVGQGWKLTSVLLKLRASALEGMLLSTSDGGSEVHADIASNTKYVGMLEL